jgi:hypothetical protein
MHFTLAVRGLEEATIIYYLFGVQGCLVYMVFMHLWKSPTNAKCFSCVLYDSYIENAMGPRTDEWTDRQIDRHINPGWNG